jgi:hypothetical protein
VKKTKKSPRNDAGKTVTGATMEKEQKIGIRYFDFRGKKVT